MFPFLQLLEGLLKDEDTTMIHVFLFRVCKFYESESEARKL